MNSHLGAIRTLATTQKILDGLLFHIVTRKLDQRTQEKWEKDLSTTELSTCDAMDSFLEKRCRMMENWDRALVTQAPGQQVGKTCTNISKMHLLLLLQIQII